MMVFRRQMNVLLFAIVWAFILGGCANMKDSLHKTIDAMPGGEQKEVTDIKTFEPVYSGRRARIAVLRFTDATTKRWGYNRNLGDEMAGHLQTALVKTNMFRVLNRKNMRDMMKEIGFSGSGAVAPQAAVQFGRMAGAKLVITAAITEFQDSGQPKSRANTNRSDSSTLSDWLSKIQTHRTRMKVNLEIVDVETSEVVASEVIEGDATKFSIDMGSGRGSRNDAFGSWGETPKGKALSMLIDNAVDYIKTSVPGNYFTDPPAVAGLGAQQSPQLLEKNKEFQSMLKELGYYNGRIDGLIGEVSRQAIKDFQLDYTLPATGQIDQMTQKKLREVTNPQPVGLK